MLPIIYRYDIYLLISDKSMSSHTFIDITMNLLMSAKDFDRGVKLHTCMYAHSQAHLAFMETEHNTGMDPRFGL